jgi:quercetin dioxygenase-like cupin family protein
MKLTWTTPRVLIAVAAAAVCAFFLARAGTASPAAAPQRVDIATGLPAFAPGYRLSLTRAIIPAGAGFAPHRHPGMQVSYIEAGTLQFTVFRGAVHVYRGIADGSQTLVRTISSHETGSIHSGEWIVENPSVWHQGTNPGKSQVVILLATLLRAKEPAAIPVKP